VKDILFWLFVLGMMMWLGRRRRPPPDQDAPETIQSYRIMDGPSMMLAPTAAHPLLKWRVLSVEELPTQHRRRMILHISVDDPMPPAATLARLLWSLASGVQRKARAHAVVVEAFSSTALTALAPSVPGNGVLRLLLALDGHGWSGQAPLIACLDAPQTPPQLFTLAQVHELLSATSASLGSSLPLSTLDASRSPS
jgi:hypothetical protein